MWMQLLFMKPAYKLFQASSKFYELLSGYHAFLGNWRMELCRIQVPSSSCLETWVLNFWNKRIDLLLKLFSRIALFLFSILTKAKLLPSFLLSSNQAYVELWVGVKRHVCFAYIVKSKTRSKQKQVIQSDQDVQVCGNFFGHGWMNSFAWSLSPLYFPWMWTIFLFSFLFWHALWACGIPMLGPLILMLI